MAKLKIYLNPDECIGCGLCNKICPDIFGMQESLGVAKVLRPESDDLNVVKAKDSCPVGCIRVM